MSYKYSFENGVKLLSNIKHPHLAQLYNLFIPIKDSES